MNLIITDRNDNLPCESCYGMAIGPWYCSYLRHCSCVVTAAEPLLSHQVRLVSIRASSTNI
jgi:hypothetical protein